MFWTIAAIALFTAAVITVFPLFRGKTFWQPVALALAFLLPATGLWMYNSVGTPEGIDMPVQNQPAAPHAETSDEPSMELMAESLRGKLTERLEDLEGWMLLARTLKTMQRYQEAAEALETANRISPDNPQVLVELVEARIFLSGDGTISNEMVATLERVLELQPDMQKALWLLGIASAQAGDDAFAISYWQSLLDLLEPGSPVAQSVQSQIDEAKTRLGMDLDEPVPEMAADGGWAGITLQVSAAAEAPRGGVLYVMVRPSGPAVGPPLGVRRVANPALPLEMKIDDRDSMMEERQISSESEIQLQARISLTGAPGANSGDWQSAPVTVPRDSGGTVELILDQQVE